MRDAKKIDENEIEDIDPASEYEKQGEPDDTSTN